MTTSRLIGRAEACARVSEFVGHAAFDGGALLVVGDPGIGKSALLQVASDLATEGATGVLRAEGVEFETDVSHAVLNQLLVPLSDPFPRLSALQAEHSPWRWGSRGGVAGSWWTRGWVRDLIWLGVGVRRFPVPT